MIEFHAMRLRPSRTAELLVATDWEGTSLGHPSRWPAAWRTAVQLCLNSPFPMTLIWGERLITVYNDGFLPIMGSKHPRGFGRPVGDVYPELVDELGAPLRGVLDRGETVYESNRMLPLRRAGSLQEAYFTFSYCPLNDESGSTRGVLAVATETTAHVLQERRARTLGWLAEELSKLRALQPVAPVMQQAFAGNRADFAATALLELAPDGAQSVQWAEPPQAAAALLEDMARHDVSATLRWGERHATVLPLGERSFALTMVDEEALKGLAYVLLIEPGERVEVDAEYRGLLRMLQETLVGVVYRVFAERQALDEVTRQLDERNRLYRLLFERSQDCIFMCSPNGRITAANPAACELLGYTEAEICRIGRAGVVHPRADLERCMAERQRQSSFVGELDFRHKDGTRVTVDVSSSLFMDEASGEEHAITLFRDAAPRLLTQERLTAAARLEAVGALTGGIAHDFNNLLNVIINGGEDLVDRLPAHDDAHVSADMVLTAATRAADLTRQLLAFSRQQPMARRSVDVGSVVSELDQMLSRTMGGLIRVALSAEAGHHALTDRSLLQSAILNLCINARDAMPEGGELNVCTATVQVEASLARDANLVPGEYVRIRVTDTGVGIPREHMGRILEPFFTTKPVGQGTGLGLSMVFGFARQSGGGVHVHSAPGQGTRVDLYLPAAEPESGASRAPEEALPAVSRDRPGAAARRHILIVEDDELLAAMLARILEDAGFRVSIRADGERALAMLARSRDIALVITDILLGRGMDGWTLARRVAERWPLLPVVTMSGFTPDGAGRERRTPMLHKPFRPREVLALLNDLLAA